MTVAVRAHLTTSLAVAALSFAFGIPRAEAQALGYAIAGPAGYSGFFGSSSGLVHAAAGGEYLFPGGVGAGAELGLLGGRGGGLLVLSLNGTGHFGRNRSRRGFDPFVTGGFTGFGDADGSFKAWNIGGGADYWIKDGVGLRMEFRDHARPDTRGTVQYWAVRLGIVFR